MKTRSGRRAIRLMDLADLDTLPHKIDACWRITMRWRRGLKPGKRSTARVILQELTALAPQLLPYAETVWRLLDQKRREGSASCSRRAGARCWMSITAPIPTSPRLNTVAAQAATGTGMGPSAVVCPGDMQGLYRPGSARGRFRRAGQ